MAKTDQYTLDKIYFPADEILQYDEDFFMNFRKKQLISLIVKQAEIIQELQQEKESKMRKESTGRNPTYYGSLGQILRMRDDGKSIREIAEVVKLSPATVCRVLKKYAWDDLFQN